MHTDVSTAYEVHITWTMLVGGRGIAGQEGEWWEGHSWAGGRVVGGAYVCLL